MIPEDAYVLTPCGPLGSETEVQGYHAAAGSYESTEEALAAVHEDMVASGYYPDIYWMSDHGNAWPIDLEGNEIKLEEDEE